MPGFNGKGPEGDGPRTGRGRGNCDTDNAVDNSNLTLGVGRGGKPRGGGRGHCFGGGRRRNGAYRRGNRDEK